MKKFLPKLAACQFLLLAVVPLLAQPLVPFENCPGVSVAVTRPGFNATLGPHQIYLIDSAGHIQPSGEPINLQINGFGLNGVDGFLYGMHQSFNIVNPFLTRVDKNGHYETVGTLLGPPVDNFKSSLINTAAGTMDDKDNYYFTAVVINLQNILLPPDLYVGKVEHVSDLAKSEKPLAIKYTKIDAGTCADELLTSLQNPREGALQDIAYNPFNGRIYTFIPAPGTTPMPGKIAWFDPANNPTFTCFDPPQPNIPTNDLSGLYFGRDSLLYILTIDGKYYKGNVQTGAISMITQTTLPVVSGNLRGDMASCVGGRSEKLLPFTGCPGVSVAVTRPGINSTNAAYHIYLIDKAGNTQPTGNPISNQINAFGLNNEDGFLYGMHESGNVINPWLSRVDKNGTVVDLSRLAPPQHIGRSVGMINTAAATMDGKDNYYFTAVVVDTTTFTTFIPRLYLGTIKHVSKLKPGDKVRASYRPIIIGSCVDEIIRVLMHPEKGLLQDISFNPVNGRIYTVIPTNGESLTPVKIASFNPGNRVMILNCINPPQPNMPINDLSGLFSDNDGALFILTTDGKFYKGNVTTGVISTIKQTSLPLLGNNLRGDMASCVERDDHNNDRMDVSDNSNEYVRMAPNPARTDQVTLSVQAEANSRVEMQIIDSRGNRVQTRSLSLMRGLNRFTVDVSDLTKGLYHVVLAYGSGRRTAIKIVRL